jgi:hypothetical protein
MSTPPVGAAQPSRLGRSPRPRAGTTRIRRVLALAGCGVLGVGLSACESTEQESAKIGRESEAAARAAAKPATSTHAGARGRGHAHAAKTGTAHKGRAAP